jgi:hypothetical protein
MSREEIKEGQDKIKVSLNSLDAMIHLNAVQCMLHAEKHGDTSLMARLLMDIIDPTSGYRRAGLIQWMRAFSPMELDGKVIKLSGTDPKTGERRPWKVEEANATPFAKADRFKEMVKPVFSTVLMSSLDKAIKDYQNANANTIIGPDGKPTAIDKGKPFLLVDNVEAFNKFFDNIATMKAELPTVDLARDRYMNEQEAARIAREEFLSGGGEEANRTEEERVA